MDERILPAPELHVSVFASDLPVDQGPDRPVRRRRRRSSSTAARCSRRARGRWSGSRSDPHYFAKPDRALFQDIRRYFPITVQAQVAWAVKEGVGAAVVFIEEQIEAGAFDGGVARCHATTRKGKPCQRTPLPERDYCPSHQHLERSKVAA